MATNDKALGFLGLLYVSGEAVIGEDLGDLRKCKLLIAAKDASSNQALSLKRKAREMHLPMIEEYSKSELGHALGKGEVAFVGITESRAASAFIEKAGLLKGVRKT